MTANRLGNAVSYEARYSAFHKAAIIGLLLTLYYLACVYLFLTKLQEYAYCQIFVANPNAIKIFIGYITIIAVGLLMRKEPEPYNLFLWTIYIAMIVPRFVVYACRDTGFAYPYTCLLIFLIATIVSNILLRDRSIKIAKQHNKTEIGKYALWTVIIITVAMLVSVIALKGLPTARAFNLNDTYEIRAANNLPSIVNSFLSFLGIFALPYSIALFVTRNNYKGGVLLTIAQLALFLWTANKAWLFMIPLAWFLPLLTRRNKLTVTTICAFMAGLVLFFAIYCSISNSNLSTWLFSLFYRRLIFVPAALGNVYYDFFQTNPIILFDGTILGALTPTPEQYKFITYQVQIGPLAFGGSSEAYANTGIFGGEFANFGSFGWAAILIGTIAISLFLGSERNSKEGAFRMVIAVLLAYGLLNYTYMRLFLSVTGILALILLYAYFKEFSGVRPVADEATHNERKHANSINGELQVGMGNV